MSNEDIPLSETLRDTLRDSANEAGMTERELFEEICDLGEQELYGFVLPKPYDPSSN